MKQRYPRLPPGLQSMTLKTSTDQGSHKLRNFSSVGNVSALAMTNATTAMKKATNTSKSDATMESLVGESISLDEIDNFEATRDDHDDNDYSVCQLIDENKGDCAAAKKESQQHVIAGSSQTLSPRTVSHIETCPCCKRSRVSYQSADGGMSRSSSWSTMMTSGTATTISGCTSADSMSSTRVVWVTGSRSLFTEMMNDDDDHSDVVHVNGSNTRKGGCDDDSDDDEVDRMMPGLLSKGTPYKVKKVIVKGHLQKKGSGFDWLGSRSWKSRWAVLVRARVDGHDIDLPLLEIYWTSTSPTPSTVITLDSAVIVPENLTDSSKSNHNPYRFKIRHIKKSINCNELNTVQLTRVFSCTQEERDEWLSAINQALLDFEKEKASSRRRSVLSASPPQRSTRRMSMSATGDIAPNALFHHHRRCLSTGSHSIGIY